MLIKRVVYGVCAVTIMIMIFCFSSQTYDATMKTSDVIVKPIESTVKKESTTFENKKDEEEYLKNLEKKLDKVVRKSAHMIIFGVLALFVYLLCKSFGMNDSDAIIMTLVVCAVYAGTDEFHQKFVEGRTSQFADVCVDEMGAVISMTIIRAIKKIKVEGN